MVFLESDVVILGILGEFGNHKLLPAKFERRATHRNTNRKIITRDRDGNRSFLVNQDVWELGTPKRTRIFFHKLMTNGFFGPLPKSFTQIHLQFVRLLLGDQQDLVHDRVHIPRIRV